MTTPAHRSGRVPTDPENGAAAHRSVDGGPPAAPRDLVAYLGLLADALRARGARGTQVREIVGEVRAHCRATGEHPVDAFGLPEVYASTRHRPLSLLAVLARILAGALGALGLSALVLWIIPAFPASPQGMRVVRVGDLWAPTLALMVLSLVPWLVYAVERLVLPRRLAAPHPTRGAWVIRGSVVAVVFGVFLAGGPIFGPEDVDRVLFSAPRWTFLVVGLVLLPLLALSTPGDRVVPTSPRGSEPRASRFERLLRRR